MLRKFAAMIEIGAKSLTGKPVEGHLDSRGPLHRYVGGLPAQENAAGIHTGKAKCMGTACPAAELV